MKGYLAILKEEGAPKHHSDGIVATIYGYREEDTRRDIQTRHAGLKLRHEYTRTTGILEVLKEWIIERTGARWMVEDGNNLHFFTNCMRASSQGAQCRSSVISLEYDGRIISRQECLAITEREELESPVNEENVTNSVESDIKEILSIAEKEAATVIDLPTTTKPDQKQIDRTVGNGAYKHEMTGLMATDVPNYVSEVITDLSQLTTGLVTTRAGLYKRQVIVEEQINDINHAIEFSNCNIINGYNNYKILQDALKERRSIKDAILLINTIVGTGLCDVDLMPIKTELDNMEARRYAPRQLPELFEHCKESIF